MADITEVSPLAPAGFPDLPIIDGVRFAAAEAGVKYQGRKDVTLIELAQGSTVAGVFTKSATRSANVLDCQKKVGLDSDLGAAFIINSGNSNAFTGRAGDGSVAAICEAVAAATGLPETRVFTSSTGVIGERLPHDRITAKVGELVQGLTPDAIEDAALGIMTTDTYAKGASTEVVIDGKPVKIAGIAKGSGLLQQRTLSELTDVTFNAITVDSDTSTSDTLLLGATGASDVEITETTGAFRDGLHQVMQDLAHLVVRDGEGATKFVEIAVTGAASDADAKTHALAIANSPLVKTAIAGEDPNWGRIVMAIGKSGAAADRDLLTIRFGDILVAEKGWVAESYTEEAGAAYMKAQELKISVDLGLDTGKATVWTCDLTHGYITINADYRS